MENRFQTADRLNLFEIMLVGLSFYSSAPVIARHDWKNSLFPANRKPNAILKLADSFLYSRYNDRSRFFFENWSSYLNLDS